MKNVVVNPGSVARPWAADSDDPLDFSLILFRGYIYFDFMFYLPFSHAASKDSRYRRSIIFNLFLSMTVQNTVVLRPKASN